MSQAYKSLRAGIRGHKIATCRAAIAAGADVNEADYEGDLALVLAVEFSSPEIVRLLLDAGAGPDGRNRHHVPLTRAIDKRKFESARVLIEAGANVNIRDNALLTPLIYAAWEQSPELCRLLLEKGADPNAIAGSQNMALIAAARRSNVEICKMLIDGGASSSYVPSDARANYLTPFQNRVKKGGVAMARWLALECGEDMAQKTVTGKTMMYLAGKNEEMKALLRSLRSEAAIARAVNTSSNAVQPSSSGKSKSFGPL